jgi:O-antigen ligase
MTASELAPTYAPVDRQRKARISPSLTGIREFCACVRFAPFPVFALICYTALPSRVVFPSDDGSVTTGVSWHPAFLNACDFLLFGAIVASWLSGRLSVRRDTVLFLYLSLLGLALSYVLGSAEPEYGPLVDAMIQWLRFALVFSLALDWSERLGSRVVESLLVGLFAILAVSTLFVYRQNFGHFNRLYASAMTVASFSQITVVVLFIGLVRKGHLLLVIALLFLLLTFSLTSTLLFFMLGAVYILVARSSSLRHRAIAGIMISLVFGAGFMATKLSGRYDAIYDSRRLDSSITLHGRTEIWLHGLDLLQSGAGGIFGVGYNRTPLFLTPGSVSKALGNDDTIVHFHSIFLEYLLGLGLPALLIFFVLFRRIAQTWRYGCHPASLIYSFFLLSQSLDYTVYRPKEIVLWALVLGMAEGQWRSFRGRRTEQQRMAGTTPAVGTYRMVGGTIG